MTRNVLLTGYTGFVTDGFLAEAFPGCRVLVTGAPEVKTSLKNRISVIPGALTAEACREHFAVYGFDTVIFFSRSLAPFGSADAAEPELLSAVLKECREETKVLFLTGPRPQEGTAAAAAENTALTLCRQNLLRSQIRVLFSPWVYNAECRNPALDAFFLPGRHTFPVPEEQKCSFLAAKDLSALLKRMLENLQAAPELCHIPNRFLYTAGELTEWICQNTEKEDSSFQFAQLPPVPVSADSDSVLKQQYQWSPMYSLEEDLPSMMRRARKHPRNRPARHHGPGLPAQITVLLLGYALMEAIVQYSHTSVQFRAVDFRLLFVVIIGSLFNTPMGLCAAALASVSMVCSFLPLGLDWIDLLQMPSFWLPFIAYFAMGAVCGSIRAKDRTQLALAESETAAVKENLQYLQQLHGDMLTEKQEYLRSSAGSRDSFDRLFSMVRQLEDTAPQQLPSRILQVLEHVMGCSGIAIYAAGRSGGERIISSADTNAPCSLELAPYLLRLYTVREGDVWANRKMDPEYPGYLCGIRQDGRITAIVMLYHTRFEQMTPYHEGLFRLMCSLLTDPILHAVEHRKTICAEEPQCILPENDFLKELRFCINEKAQKQASHLLLKMSGKDHPLSELERTIRSCIRTSGSIGLIGGHPYVLLPESGEGDFAAISTRLELAGLHAQLVPYAQQHALLDGKAG